MRSAFVRSGFPRNPSTPSRVSGRACRGTRHQPIGIGGLRRAGRRTMHDYEASPQLSANQHRRLSDRQPDGSLRTSPTMVEVGPDAQAV